MGMERPQAKAWAMFPWPFGPDRPKPGSSMALAPSVALVGLQRNAKPPHASYQLRTLNDEPGRRRRTVDGALGIPGVVGVPGDVGVPGVPGVPGVVCAPSANRPWRTVPQSLC